jgi:hypothetical protein
MILVLNAWNFVSAYNCWRDIFLKVAVVISDWLSFPSYCLSLFLSFSTISTCCIGNKIKTRASLKGLSTLSEALWEHINFCELETQSLQKVSWLT